MGTGAAVASAAQKRRKSNTSAAVRLIVAFSCDRVGDVCLVRQENRPGVPARVGERLLDETQRDPDAWWQLGGLALRPPGANARQSLAELRIRGFGNRHLD